MTDLEFLRHLKESGKTNWYLFGSLGFWKINNTGLSLSEKQRLVEKPYCVTSESEWRLVTTRFFVGVKLSAWGTSLEKFWNSIDFSEADAEGKRLDDWFSALP